MSLAKPGWSRGEVVRDLLWRNIALEPAALEIVDTPAFQRLRYVRQLGHAFLVYPGATHTRFEHALGAYGLARRALDTLRAQPGGDSISDHEALFIRLGALLHDIGHYPFSHALEEAGFTSHERVAAELLARAPLREVLANHGFARPEESFGALVRGQSAHPLAGLITGSIDVDKIDYLKRDALMCGVPYGEVDVDRLLACLTVAELDGRRAVGILEKGVAALESLLFAKYQMYRNVYWHHAVRSATAMFKRLVREAVNERAIDPSSLIDATDDALMHDLAARDRTGIAGALRERRLFKRALELLPGELQAPPPSWLRDDAARLAGAEDSLARAVGLGPSELLIDLPHKEAMLGLDLPIVRRDGSVERLTHLPPLAAGLAESACRLRVFVGRPVEVGREALLEVLAG